MTVSHVSPTLSALDPLRAPKPGDGKRSSHWPAFEKDWLKEHGQCVACGGTAHLQVHHLRPFHLFPDLELDAHNVMTLCEDPARNCHHWFGHSLDWKAYNPNAREDAALEAKRIHDRRYG